jgi:hypothetical protein
MVQLRGTALFCWLLLARAMVAIALSAERPGIVCCYRVNAVHSRFRRLGQLCMRPIEGLCLVYTMAATR